MNCNKIIEENITEELFLNEIEKAKNCVAKVLNIDIQDICEVANENVFVTLDNRKTTLCQRKIFSFKTGSIDCYMSHDLTFIEIFHHPN